MIIVLIILLFFSLYFIFYAMIGYPFLLYVIEQIKKPKKIQQDYSIEPTITYMIVVHNEEKVMLDKLKNTLELDYPNEKLEILIASDYSTDRTNEIVEEFIKNNKQKSIRLYCTKEHKGKTNAQNEAQKTVKSEILIMTDANSMLKEDALRELVSCFTNDEIVYVCGRLIYSNEEKSLVSGTESSYWNYDLKMRDIESRIQTITAGNGAIYACRNNEYIKFPPIRCHDNSMPLYYGLQGKRALFNPKAIAYEKAGENTRDEFKRKVRMNRNLLMAIKEGFQTINIFRLKWFSFFYFGHRTCRRLLWFNHIILFLCTIFLTFLGNVFGIVFFALQIVVIILAMCQMKWGIKNRYLRFLGYYGITVLAQYIAIYNIIMKRTKSTWDKAESTR